MGCVWVHDVEGVASVVLVSGSGGRPGLSNTCLMELMQW